MKGAKPSATTAGRRRRGKGTGKGTSEGGGAQQQRRLGGGWGSAWARESWLPSAPPVQIRPSDPCQTRLPPHFNPTPSLILARYSVAKPCSPSPSRFQGGSARSAPVRSLLLHPDGTYPQTSQSIHGTRLTFMSMCSKEEQLHRRTGPTSEACIASFHHDPN